MTRVGLIDYYQIRLSHNEVGVMVFDKVKQIISEQFNISENEITLALSFIDDLNTDSLDLFQIIMAVEEEFELEISSEAAEKISTVRDIVEYIKQEKELD